MFNPFTAKSDQFQISPAASPEILHHTEWRTWPFIAYSDEIAFILPIPTTSLMQFSLKGWENLLFEFGSKNVQRILNTFDFFPISLFIRKVTYFFFLNHSHDNWKIGVQPWLNCVCLCLFLFSYSGSWCSECPTRMRSSVTCRGDRCGSWLSAR